MDRLFFSKLAVYFDGTNIPLEEKIERLNAIESIKSDHDCCFVIGSEQFIKEAIIYKTLLNSTPGIIKRRARGMRVVPKAVTNYHGNPDIPVINFRFTSVQKTEGKGHNAWVALLDGKSEGNVKVHCDCKYFMYTLEVALARKNASDIIQSNGEAPVVRNPGMRTYLCKHLVMASGYVGIIPETHPKILPKYLKTPRHKIPPEELRRLRRL